VNGEPADWRTHLPVPGERRLAVRTTPDAARQLRSGSPWLYDGSVVSVSHEAATGDLAVVFDDRRRFVALGLWDPASPIRVKVLHAGEPATIDAAWFATAIRAAVSRRDGLARDASPDTVTDAYRCVHGENDGLPGLIVDRYAGTLVVKLYTPAWFPHLVAVVDALTDLLAPQRIVLRLGRDAAARNTTTLRDGDTLAGPAPTRPIRFRERGLLMEADVVRGQKTGHFLDQRDNRALVRSAAAGRTVLDVFASTGGFSLSAAAGGARSVHLVDQSSPALDAARRNLELNRHLAAVRECAVRITVGDAFDVMADLARQDERYDLVVVDPPSFAHDAAGVDRALRAYGRLTRGAVELLRPGGLLVQASCSSRVSSDALHDTVAGAVRRTGRSMREIRRTGHALDHPVGFEYGAYLCAVFAEIR
jgi:23S rRNA (cytosine1962-C5)-methyltransferase